MHFGWCVQLWKILFLHHIIPTLWLVYRYWSSFKNRTGVPLVAGICRVVSKDRRSGISPVYFHIGNKKKTEPKELPSHSIHCLLTAFTQWQIQGRGPPYLRVWMTPPPPTLISRSGSGTVYITGNLKYQWQPCIWLVQSVQWNLNIIKGQGTGKKCEL